MRRLDVILLPAMMPDDIGDDHMVVIDILRASTTMVQALDSGAIEIVPCLEIEDALQQKNADPSILLGGERGGEPIQGFDLGNSPLEYSPNVVAGKRIALTTSNGTRALKPCTKAGDVVVGAFTNISAVTRYLMREQSEGTAYLVCAGTIGKVSLEDTLFAGALTAQLQTQANWNLSDTALLALNAWNGIAGIELDAALADGAGGRNLQRLGRHDDIRHAATMDSSSRVPRYHNGILR